MNIDEITMTEIREKWMAENKIHNLEGTRGVNGLQKILGAIGYKDGNYLGYNVEILNFLSDNSGAIEAILNWIDDQECPEWKETLVEELKEEIVSEEEQE